MLTYKETKDKGLTLIGKAITGVGRSDDHETNKTLLYAILESTQELLRLEDLMIATENGDLDGQKKAMERKWIL